MRAHSNYFDSNNGKKNLIGDGPPIVFMKPMNVLRAKPEENDSQKLVRKSKMKDINRGHVDFDEVCRRLRGEVTQMRRQGFEEKELSDKLKALESVDQREKKKRLERVNKVKEPNKKLEEMQNFKLKTASTSHDQAKVNNMKERKTRKNTSAVGEVFPCKNLAFQWLFRKINPRRAVIGRRIKSSIRSRLSILYMRNM